MAAGRDLAWRRQAAVQIVAPAGARILDLGAGTADMSLALARRHPQAHITALDFSAPMLALGRRKAAQEPAGRRIAFALGDALRLPLPDAQFDAVTSAFLLRNVASLEQAFAEMTRVTRPGGSILCLELTRPTAPLFRQAFALYFGQVVPRLGRLVSRHPEAYRYLPESLARFVSADALRRVMERAGLEDVRYRRLMAGTVAIHTGRKPATG